MNTPNDVQQASCSGWKVVCRHSGEQAKMVCMNEGCQAPAFTCCKDQHCLSLHEHQGTVLLRKWEQFTIMTKRTTYVSKLFEEKVTKLQKQFSQLFKDCQLIEKSFIQKVKETRQRLYGSFPGSETIQKLQQGRYQLISGGEMARFIKLLQEQAYRDYRKKVLEEEQSLRHSLKQSQIDLKDNIKKFNGAVVKRNNVGQHKQLIIFICLVACMAIFSSLNNDTHARYNLTERRNRTIETWLDAYAQKFDRMLDLPVLAQNQLVKLSQIFNDETIKYLLAVEYYRNSQFQMTLEMLNEINKKQPKYLYLQGLALESKNEFSEALTKFREASRMQPDSIIYHLKISSIYRILKKYDEAQMQLHPFMQSSDQQQLRLINQHVYLIRCMRDKNCQEPMKLNELLEETQMETSNMEKPLKKRMKKK